MTPSLPLIEERTLWRLAARRAQQLVRRDRIKSVKPAKNIGVGLVGLGNVARWLYLPRLQRPDSGFKLKAAFDVDTIGAQKVGKSFEAAACSSLLELVNHPEVEAVFVCTPTPFHCEAVLAALNAKKHVLCEKPLGGSKTEAASMWEASRLSGSVAMVNFSYRFRADLLLAESIIRSGTLGQIYHLWGSLSQGNWFDETGLPSKQRGDASAWKFGRSGGVLLDLGPHVLDLCRCWLGEVMEVQAWTRGPTQEPDLCEAACGLSLRFLNGARAQLLTSRLATGSKEQTFLEISGTRGSLRLDQRSLSLWTVETPKWRRILVPQQAPDFLTTFHAAISHPPGILPNFWDGLKNNELIDAIYLSARSGTTVSIPQHEVPATHQDTH